MDTVWQDLRYVLRSLLRRPGFATVALVTIALGIAANTAIFSVVNGVLLRPPPLHEPDELVVPDVIAPTGFEISLSIPNFKDWREKNRTFVSFGANAGRSRTLTGYDEAEIIRVRLVLGDFFETLGVSPVLGRTIPSDETWAGAEPVAVVSHGFWTRRLGADPDALGQTITLDGEPFTVVGVMPEGLNFPTPDTEAYLPMGFYSDRMCWEIRGCSQGTWAIGRLDEGVTLGLAQEDMDRVTREIQAAEGQEVATTRLQSLKDAYIGELRAPVWILMGAVSFVLLIACANVASLLLARGESRRAEIALRRALGAGRGRVIRQFLTESGVLALTGGILGTGLAFVALRLMIPALPDAIPAAVIERVGLDGRVLLFTLGISVLSGVVFGIVPALKGSRQDLTGELKDGRRGTASRERQKLRSAFVVAQVALSLVLLIGAGLMIRSLEKLQDVEKGFVAEQVFTAEISLPSIKYPDKEAAWGFFRELVTRVEGLPGVRSASLSNLTPLEGNSWERGIIPEGVELVRENFQSVLFQMVTPGHFETLGIPLIRGRGFSSVDVSGGPPVAIIDETMAERYWPDENPIGKRVTFETVDGSEDPTLASNRIYREVIGVVRNVRHYELESPSRIQVYVPFEQSGTSWSTQMDILVKTAGDPYAMGALVRNETRSMDRDVPLADVRTVQENVETALSGTRAMGGMLTVFSVVALVLSGIGIFGVMSFSVVQRIREIGIRMALGAHSRDVVRMVSLQGLTVTLIGVVLGLLAAFGLTRVMTSVLFQVDPVEPLIYGGFAVFLLVMSAAACYLPVRRATRVDPALVLREE